MKKMNLIIFGVVLVVIVVVAAVILYRPASQPLMVLRVSTAGEPITLDPHNERSSIDIIIFSQIHETLVSPRWKEGFQLLPGLALSWDLVDNTTWRFCLREGLTFHDGTPFNATAVKYNFDRLLDEDRATTSASLIEGKLKSVEIVDEYTVLFNTVGPWPDLPFASGFDDLGIVSPTAVEKHGDEDYGRHPVGTGPFKFVEWIEGQYVKLERNDEYWGDVPKLSEVVFKIIPEEGTRYMAFLAGELDIISNVPPHRAAEIEADPEMVLLKSMALRTIFFGLNTQRPPLNDVNLRRAIAHTLDRDSIFEYVLENLGTVAYVPVPPGGPDRLPEEEYGPGGRYPLDIDEAKRLIADAGWVDTNDDGIVEKDGQDLEINFIAPSGRYLKDREIAEVMAEWLEDIGFRIDLEILEVSDFFSRVTAADYDMHLLGWGLPAGLDAYLKRIWWTADPDLGRGAWSAYSSAEYDEFIELADGELDPAKRTEYYQEAQRILMEDVPMIPIYYTMNIYATTADVENFEAKANEAFILIDTTVSTD